MNKQLKIADKVKGYKCTLCELELDYIDNEQIMTCPKCGQTGILDVIYNYDNIKQKVNQKYFIENKAHSIWRYQDMMSVEPDGARSRLTVGWTPLYRSINLADYLQMAELYIKDEGVNPTGSLKDRASAVAVTKALEFKQELICCSSTGNAASSLAGNAANAGIKTMIFVPGRAPQGKLAQLLIYGANVISVQGDYQQTFNLSAAAIERWACYNRNAAINPHLVEGKKTVALEIAEQMAWRVPDWVIVSVGDGCTIAGVYKGFADLLALGIIEHTPKILGVQAAGCSPLSIAMERITEKVTNELMSAKDDKNVQQKVSEKLKKMNGRKFIQELIPADEDTIADSIAVGVPRNPIKALRAVILSDGSWINVSDLEILDAMQLLGQHEGVFSEPAAAAGVAGLVKALAEGVIKHSESVALISTGNGLKDVKNAILAAGEPLKLQPDVKELERIKI